MAFPASPTDGQTYTQYGRTFIYTSSTSSWRTYKNSDLAQPLTALNGITSTTLTTTGNVTLGTVANVHITGGTSGQVLSTDGSGNLSFVNNDPVHPFIFLGI